MAFTAKRQRYVQRLWLVLPAWAALGWVLPASAEDSPHISLGAYAAQLSAAASAAHTCAASAAACNASGVPGREQVDGGPGGSFSITWVWLSDALGAAKTAKPEDRLRSMQAVDGHLRWLAAETGQGHGADAVPVAEFGRARTAANAALARDEFRASSQGPSWYQRKLARIQDWLLRLFNGMDRLGRKAPWLAPLIEWGCFGLAVAGLLWFVRRNLQRQALRITLTEGAALLGAGGREIEDWQRMAGEQAAAGAWRDAVHSLYWAGIALLESRRAWRPNVARTPREYLRLLRPGSEAQRALRELTRDLERVWYGSTQAEESQYRHAQSSLEALRAAKAERAPSAGEESKAAPVLPAVGSA